MLQRVTDKEEATEAPLEVTEEYRTPPPSRRRSIGCAVFGWLGFFLALAFIGLIAFRTWGYMGSIRRGEIVHLPQFPAAFTRAGATRVTVESVPRALVESDDAAAVGAEHPNAKLTIVEFADFECPYSKDASTVLRSVAARYSDRVRVIYRHLPLDALHSHAHDAALASTCAQEQGKFWAYHDRLYINAPALDSASLLRYATESGLDQVQFEKCFTDRRYEARVNEDAKLAQSLGLAGTPTFFFNGQKVEGAIPAAEMERIVKEMTAN